MAVCFVAGVVDACEGGASDGCVSEAGIEYSELTFLKHIHILSYEKLSPANSLTAA